MTIYGWANAGNYLFEKEIMEIMENSLALYIIIITIYQEEFPNPMRDY